LLNETVRKFAPLWHGTDDQPFQHFKAQGHSYLGIYGTSDKEYAKNFGKNLTRMEMQFKNPLFLNMDDKDAPNYASPSNGEIVLNNKIVGFYRKLTKETISLLQKMGYDGIVVKFRNNDTFEVVSFEPENVKILSWND
jgi:hypothetical protein